MAELLAEDVRATMPPFREWFQGRDEVMAALTTSWDAGSPNYVGRFRMVPTAANCQPAVAAYPVFGLPTALTDAMKDAFLSFSDRKASFMAFRATVR